MPIPRRLYKIPSATSRLMPFKAVAGLILYSTENSVIEGICPSSGKAPERMPSSRPSAICWKIGFSPLKSSSIAASFLG